MIAPQRYPQNLHTPKNIHFSENPPKILEFKNFEPQKMVRAYVCMKISKKNISHTTTPSHKEPKLCDVAKIIRVELLEVYELLNRGFNYLLLFLLIGRHEIILFVFV